MLVYCKPDLINNFNYVKIFTNNNNNINLTMVKFRLIKKYLFTFLFVTCLFFVSQGFARDIVTYSVNGRPVEAVKGELLVKFSPTLDDAKKEEIIHRGGAKKIRKLNFSNIVKLELSDGSFENKLRAFNSVEGIEYAEPNIVFTSMQAINLPPVYADEQELKDNQWGMHKIDAHYGWAVETGSETVISLIDSGVDIDHQEFEGNIWQNPGEEENGEDTDGNGYPDDLYGWDFVDEDNDPRPSKIPEESHGTHVAGIVGASGSNEIAGVSWANKLMALRVLSYNSDTENVTGSLDNLIEAIDYSVSNGAHIINMSLGTEDSSALLKEAVEYAYNQGCVLVAASGNSDKEPISYPARYKEVIAVGATDSNDNRASLPFWGSSYGEKLDLMAPGVNIKSTLPGDSYGYSSGTSMAAPFVSGLASLIISYYGEMDPEELKIKLTETTDNLNEPGWDKYTGHGRINCFKVLSFYISVFPDEFDILSVVGQPAPEDRIITVSYNGGQKSTLTWTIDNEPEWINLSSTSGSLNYQETEDINIEFDTESLSTGSYTADIKITSEESSVSTRTVRVGLDKIIAIPSITPDKEKINFYSLDRDKTLKQNLNLANSGDQYSILDWEFEYSSPWLVFSATRGTLNYGQSVDLAVTADLTGSVDGDYRDTLVISDRKGEISPVKLEIKAVPLSETGDKVALVGGSEGYVNPLKAETAKIILNTSRAGTVKIKIFDRRGRMVWEKDKYLKSGENKIDWACDNIYGEIVASGIYFVRIVGPGIDTTEKIAVIR